MQLIDKICSTVDKTVKFIFQLDCGLITEVAYINKDDGKDILCVSCQTACKLACKFCFTTDALGKIRTRSLTGEEIVSVVSSAYDLLELAKNERMLLISYMGCGEPLCNTSGILSSMRNLRDKYKQIRFAIATLIPHYLWTDFFRLVQEVQIYKFNLKLHLSLHFTNDEVRQEWMPAALPIGPAVAMLEFYRKLTGNSVEVHYALIDGVNDHMCDADALAKLLGNRDIPVKLLQYNEREVVPEKHSEPDAVQRFMDNLERQGIKTEYYVPPGKDCGASCGAFLLDYYLKYNGVKG